MKTIKAKLIVKVAVVIIFLIPGLVWFGFFDLFICSPFGQIPLLDNPPWGLSKEELIKSKNQPYENFDYRGADRYVYKESIAGLQADVSYGFYGERLDNIQVFFNNKHWSNEQWIKFMSDMEKHLITIAGRSYLCEVRRGYVNDEISISYRFRKGENYGRFFGSTPNGINSSTWLDLFDGRSPEASNIASTDVCLFGRDDCSMRKRKNICHKIKARY